MKMILTQLINATFVIKRYTNNDIRVRDHITGKYRRSSHQDCDLNQKLTDKVPLIFHNLRSYNSHFILRQITKTRKVKITNKYQRYTHVIWKNIWLSCWVII